MGLFDPSTSDRRVIFVLPWEGRVVAGITDVGVEIPGAASESKDQWDRGHPYRGHYESAFLLTSSHNWTISVEL
ncbi:hypothetical protein C8J56DRAFT_961954 [Mycena floridula]|nr:hypothetical protein C8J56DRAFT_971161 [Mycena floridula]KAJ7579967.1 hypothetical protein C8J56DRAFT_961954 [Mycena floridula]